MHIRNKPDFWSGIMFIAIGVAFALGASNYSMGTAARMGPGYFPFWLGTCLALLGAIVALGSCSKKAEEAEVEPFDWKIAFIVIGAVVLCGAALNFLGVYISIFLLVLISSFASHEFSWPVALITAVALVLFVWLAFIKGLGLVFPLWPVFFA
ncbi:tripartite tricarboxylate transporter TctB family protein [Alcaligenes endophyticus]|uniref:Tripartite tricarboxylate transporter TctB family protein n=1 Tax=Alcaligenes endophyticus TaxID=1929088 RepID=A0ABT8EMI8_9BURK|nr:tripartite tricarboxylate transporter TctB family protein [Alcaligenes endophyticus]MCX5590910.1 tripartite tricarboxylate transporter TctB family protein [Alcaligenes endophyticus]MDN4122513.1 tripartite tricarboxylate transporter TctB family protein [Alcaligenes endophyticus]